MDEKAYNTSLPTFLHRSQSQIDEERHRQERMRRDLNLKGAKQTPAEMAYARSFELEDTIRGNLEQIDRENHPDVYHETLLQLAEVKADQGLFAEAADIAEGSGNLAIANDYRAKHAAIYLDDDISCDCDTQTVNVQSRGLRGEPITETVEVPNEFVVQEVYSQKHARIMPLVKCANCGTMNVRDHKDVTDYSKIEIDRGPLPEAKK